MAFCTNCGTEAREARFCPSCGTQMVAPGAPGSAPQPAPPPQPRTVTVGQVKKCPSCGSPVESFQSRCNACGHELGVSKVSDAIKEFTSEINVLDEKIAKEKNIVPKQSGSTGSSRSSGSTFMAGATGAMIGSSLTRSTSRSSNNRSGSNNRNSAAGGLILIGLIAGAIALIVTIIKNFRNAVAKPALSQSEKVKKSYIENYVIPNNREDILEFILFASSKAEGVIDLGQKQSMGEVSSAHFWTKVWENKCKKVEDRALIALQGDSETMSHIKRFHDRSKEAYQKITKEKKKNQIKSIILFILMLIGVTAISAIILLLLLMFL